MNTIYFAGALSGQEIDLSQSLTGRLAKSQSKDMTTAIQKWGKSLALRIPSAVARQLHVGNGDAVEMSVESGALKIRAARPRYQLSALVKGIHAGNRHQEVEWGKSVGREN